MEDVLEVYALPYDAAYPQVCFDERPVQLLGEVYDPIPAQPGQVRRYDYEYKRQGTANLFVMCQPLAGWREVKGTDQRQKVDFAHCMKDLVDIHFPDAERIRVVLDNLNTHTAGALYEAFTPEEARRILRKLEFLSLYGRKCTRGVHPKCTRCFHRNGTNDVQPEWAR